MTSTQEQILLDSVSGELNIIAQMKSGDDDDSTGQVKDNFTHERE